MRAGRKCFSGIADIRAETVFLRAGRKLFRVFRRIGGEARSFAQTANCDILKYYA